MTAMSSADNWLVLLAGLAVGGWAGWILGTAFKIALAAVAWGRSQR